MGLDEQSLNALTLMNGRAWPPTRKARAALHGENIWCEYCRLPSVEKFADGPRRFKRAGPPGPLWSGRSMRHAMVHGEVHYLHAGQAHASFDWLRLVAQLRARASMW
eukprot:CAMPEP_0203846272 /NCGR_PEP_ID=MMETSP0359-20131031/4320_1 /ASSEMBLY_ACC=CAM_ASM_000338 /TAXON_ID=268821 /ORGANISM="Scrippsiella Hangoei, Strain SHTV-5" /LENGTH=106 /DNA_ID=CAMNT_0050761555 /DNA_START=85 /DNA_END=402 /DNA_ORIENTATION=-